MRQHPDPAETLGDWAFTSHHLHFAPFANSLARTVLLEGATPTEVCDLFALHSPTLYIDHRVTSASCEGINSAI